MKSNVRQPRFAYDTHATAHKIVHKTTWVMILLACTLSGCTICQECGDLDYPTYGGAWERTRRDSGRVGSVFDPAGARVASLSPRDSDSEDSSIREPGKKAATEDDGFDRSDDPLSDKDTEESPSDKDKGSGKDPESIRDLDLEDINMEDSDLLPPDV